MKQSVIVEERGTFCEVINNQNISQGQGQDYKKNKRMETSMIEENGLSQAILLNNEDDEDEKRQKQIEIKDQFIIGEVEKEQELQILQMTEQIREKLKKYQIEKKDLFKSSIKLFSSHQSLIYIQWIFFFRKILFDLIGSNQYVASEPKVCPIRSQTSEYVYFIAVIIFKLLEALTLFIACKSFGFLFRFTTVQKKLLIIGPQLITLTSFLMLLLNSPFELVGMEFISLLFKIFGNYVFLKALNHFSLKMRVQKETAMNFKIYYLIYCLFGLAIIKSQNAFTNIFFEKKLLNSQISLFTFFLFLMASFLLISKSSKNFIQIMRTYRTYANQQFLNHLKHCLQMSAMNVITFYLPYLIDCNQYTFYVFGNFDVRVYLLIFGLIQISGIFVFILLAFLIIMLRQRQKYIYQVSESLLSKNKNLVNENQAIPMGQCYICLSEPARFYYENCEHLYCGNNCILNCMENGGLICPICRKFSLFLVEIKRVEGYNRKFEIVDKYFMLMI